MTKALAQDFELLIKRLNDERNESETQEAKRAYSVAITNAETSQLWAAKAFSAEMVADAKVDENY